MNTFGVDLMGRRRRRRHSDEFKAMVVGECRQHGVSIAAVALTHGLNANLLRRWVATAEQQPGANAQAPLPEALPTVTPPPATQAATPAPTFVPLALTAPAVEGDIRIELQRAGTTVSIVWPAAAARDCAAWLSDWLR